MEIQHAEIESEMIKSFKSTLCDTIKWKLREGNHHSVLKKSRRVRISFRRRVNTTIGRQ